VDFVDVYYDWIEKNSKINDLSKCLILAKSSTEVENIMNSNRNNGTIGLYPDISKNNVVISVSNGTYGLNDLIKYNTILTRPPEPDKLPQIKGRIDRPGQNNNNLQMIYFVIKNTVDEGSLIRIEACNSFYNNYIMPIAEFYKISINCN
jgi:hypothetical protein